MSVFYFKQFQVRQESSSFKIGTDSVILGAWANLEGAFKILDIGAGTGLLSLMAAQRNSIAMITGVELDSQSCKEARLNFLASPWSERLRITEMNIHQYAKNALKFDYIISNPPFHMEPVVSPEIRKRIARHGKDFSLIDVPGLVSGMLTKDGKFAVVVPAKLQNKVLEITRENSFFLDRILAIRSFADKSPFRYLLEFSRIQRNVLASELTLYRAHNIPTSTYQALLSPYRISVKKIGSY